MDKFNKKGEDCEKDYDGCQDDPCAVGRNCTDKNATMHENEEQKQNDTRPYICEGCPMGYQIDDDEKCEGDFRLSPYSEKDSYILPHFHLFPKFCPKPASFGSLKCRHIW